MSKGLMGGLLGVWLSSILYGTVLALKLDPFTPAIAYTIIASILVFPLSYLAWTRPMRTLYMSIGAALMIPPALWGLPATAPLIVVHAALLSVVWRATGTRLIVAGGTLVGGVGGYLAAIATGSYLAALAPLTYHLMTVSKAAVRVTGEDVYKHVFTAAAAVIAGASLIACIPKGCTACAVLLTGDSLLRVMESWSGFDGKLGLKTYGFIETFRSLAVLLTLAALIIGCAP
ncbi:MAG: hypothetical protein F7C35_00080 [Desulfurococcales archaeon]|nr:hypothetical protein [Desulfurococcales archaeon]